MGPKKTHNKNPAVPAPQQHPPRREVKIYNITDKVIHVHKDDFKAAVQKLTGKQPTVDDDNATQAPTGVLTPGPSYTPTITPNFFYPPPVTDSQGMYVDGGLMTDAQIDELHKQIAFYNALDDL